MDESLQAGFVSSYLGSMPICFLRQTDLLSSLAPGPQTELYDKSEIDLSAPVVPAKSDEDEGIGPPHKYYKSEKLLGKLYRAVDERRIWYEDVRIDRKSSLLSFWDEFIYTMTKVCNTFGPVRWTHRVGEARLLRSA